MEAINKELIKKTENRILLAINFWRKIIRNLSPQSKIIILCSEDNRINQLTIDYLPAYVSENKVDSLLIVSQKEETIDIAREKLGSEPQYKVCDSKYIESIQKIQDAYYLFRNIIINDKRYSYNDDCTLLLNANDISPEQYVAYYILGLKEIPKGRERKLSLSHHSERTSIDYNKYEKYLMLDGNFVVNRNEYKMSTDCLIKEQLIDKTNDIYFFGKSEYAKKCIDYLSGYRIKGVLDNSANHYDWKGLNVYSPEEKIGKFDDNVRVIISIYKYYEVVPQLEKLGYILGKHILIVRCLYPEVFVSDGNIKSIVHNCVEGITTYYNNIRKKYPKELLCLSPWPTSGDIYVSGLYLKDYLLEKGIDDYIVVVPSVSTKKVAELLGYRTYTVTEDEILKLTTVGRVFGFDNLNMKNINIDNKPMHDTNRLFGTVDFNTAISRCVYNKKRKINVAFATTNADEYFEKYELNPSNTIIISPYANTLGGISEDLCDMLVRHYQKKGYQVCTNVFGDEKAISGTVGISVPYDSIIDFVNKSAGFIGMRSGLCDIVSSCSTRFCILYGNVVGTSRMSSVNYFGLAQMGLKTENILELDLEAETEETTFDQIKQFI